MQLQRVTDASGNRWHRASAEECFDVGDGRVTVYFTRFGDGAERRADFAVGIGWQDVEAIIQKFAEMGEKEALRICRARNLASMIQDFVKSETLV